MKTLHEIKNEVAKDLFDCTFLQYASFATIIDMNGFMNVVATLMSAKSAE